MVADVWQRHLPARLDSQTGPATGESWDGPSGVPLPTLRSVARECGVSVPTVSKVLNGRNGVSEATRRGVSQVLVRRGYVLRGPMRAQRGGHLLVDVVVPELASVFVANLMREVEGAARELDVDILVSGVPAGLWEPSSQWLGRVADRGTSAVVVVGAGLSGEQRIWFDGHGVPVVHLAPVTASEGLSVTATEAAAADEAVEHLLRLGHRRIGFVGGGPGRKWSRQRLRRLLASADRLGVPAPDEHVVEGSFSAQSGSESMATLMSRPVPPTAVVACSDELAVGCVRGATQLGLRVPDDVSVVGFGLTAQSWLVPALTSVTLPVAQMARFALSIGCELASGTRACGSSVVVPTSLTLGATSGPAPAVRRVGLAG